jgi:large subunit ribosomal protein L25
MSTALKVIPRNLNGPTGKQLRRKGSVPAVFYGRGVENEHYQIDSKELNRVLDSGEHIIELNVGGSRQELALIQELQKDFLTGKPLHVSFLKVRKGEKTWMTVELEFDGEAVGIKDGGDLIINLRELEIECTPENAPDRIHIDISGLNLNDSIYVRDLKLPNGVSVSEKDLDLEVVALHEHREEAEPELAAPVTEVIGKEGDAAGAAPASPAAAPAAAKKGGSEAK